MMIGALATKKRMLGLIARYADIWNGWLLHSRSHPDEVPPLTAALDDACARPAATRRRSAAPSGSWSISARERAPGAARLEHSART